MFNTSLSYFLISFRLHTFHISNILFLKKKMGNNRSLFGTVLKSKEIFASNINITVNSMYTKLVIH